MKRLFLTLGLVIAFLFSTESYSQSIFDLASYQLPKSTPTYQCSVSVGPSSSHYTKIVGTPEQCSSEVESAIERLGTAPNKNKNANCVSQQHPTSPDVTRLFCTYDLYYFGPPSKWLPQSPAPYGSYKIDSVTKSCPPDLFPSYTFGFIPISESEVTKCYDPSELDNLSKCALDVGSMLPAITNLSNKVCKTDPVTGASCGYSKKDGDVVYKADLEMNCFGDGEKVPEYDPEPMPQPDNCAKYNDQLMVCKADPKDKCDSLGNCGDQCGFVNKELFCFIECSGEDCDKPTPPPVNCETNPTAPVCVDEPPPPEFCEANPTDPKCSVQPPEPCTGDDCGSTGGVGQKVDLTPVVDQLKDLNEKLDFKTTDKTGKTNFGGFSDLFSNSDIQAIKNMTDSKKEEITQQITTIKAEFKDMFEVTAVGGAYSDITLSLSMGDFHPQFWSFIQANIGIIGAIVMALAYLMAIRVIAE